MRLALYIYVYVSVCVCSVMGEGEKIWLFGHLTLVGLVMQPRRWMASWRMKVKPVVYPTAESNLQSSAAEFSIRLTPDKVCTLVFRLPLTRP